jgi:hypothetical protein
LCVGWVSFGGGGGRSACRIPRSCWSVTTSHHTRTPPSQPLDRPNQKQPQNQELEDLRAARSPALDPQLRDAPAEAAQKLQRGAQKAVAAILQSDAPLLFPPGVLALAALRSGARAAGLGCSQFIELVGGRAAAAHAEDARRAAADGSAGAGIPGGSNAPPEHLRLGGGGAEGPEALRRLLGWMGEVDALVVAAMKEEEGLEARATEVDRAIKLWRKAAAAGGGGAAAAGSGGGAAAAVSGA